MFSDLRPIVRSTLAQSRGLYARACVIACAAVAIFFALSYAATFIDRQGIATKLESANARQAFRETWASRSGRAIPRFGVNDCLMLSSLLQDYPSRLAQAISLRIPRVESHPTIMPGEPTVPSCRRLIASLEQPNHADPQPQWYHRYLHGQRIFAMLTLAVLPPEALGWIAISLNIFALLSVLVPALRRGRGREPEAWRQRGFAAMAAALLLCSGLWLFGIYFAHGTSDAVLSLFLAYAYHRRVAHAPEPAFITSVALFGVATALFEFLTGGIPFGLALLLGIVALDGPADPPTLLRRAFHGSVIFALTTLLTFIIKIALVMLFVDGTALSDFGSGLSLRVGGTFISELSPAEVAWVSAHGIDLSQVEGNWTLSLLYMLARLAYATFVIGYGSVLFGAAIVGSAVFATAVLLVRLGRGASEAATRTRLLILLGSALVMPAWSLVFLNHTLLHAIWMVRPFGWYVALAGILLFLPLQESGSRASA